MPRRLLIIAASLAAFAAPPAASAQEWEYSVSPYMWLSGLSGKIAVSSSLPTAEVDLSFGDIFDELQIGLMSSFEARKGRLSLLGNFIYADTGAGASVSDSAVNTVHIDSETLMLGAAAAYRVSASDRSSVDVLGGVRMLSTDTNIELTFDDSTAVDGGSDATWADAIIGVRGQTAVSPHWSLIGYADIGAGYSDYTYQVYAGASFRTTEHWTLDFGYRYFDVDYDDDGFIYDVAQDGLQLGGTYHF